MPPCIRPLIVLSMVGMMLTGGDFAHAQTLEIRPPRTAGLKFFEGVRVEVGTVDPDEGSLDTTYGVATGLGTFLWPPLDLNAGLRFWSADLDQDGPEGKATVRDVSLHGDLYWHPFRMFFMRPYGLAGAALHFVGADVPGDSERQNTIEGVKPGFDLGAGVETIFTGVNVRGEVRKESGSEAGNWNVTIAAGVWPTRNAIAKPKAASSSSGGGKSTSTPAAVTTAATVPTAAPTTAAVPATSSTSSPSDVTAPTSATNPAAVAAAVTVATVAGSTTESSGATTGEPTPGAAVPAAAAPTDAVPTTLALQVQVDSLRTEVAALSSLVRRMAGSAPAPTAVAAKPPADRPAQLRAMFARLATLIGHPEAYSDSGGLLSLTVPEAVSFSSGGVTLDDVSREKIRRIAALLLVYPEVRVELIGHADNVGSARKNQSVSEARALARRQGARVARGTGGTYDRSRRRFEPAGGRQSTPRWASAESTCRGAAHRPGGNPMSRTPRTLQSACLAALAVASALLASGPHLPRPRTAAPAS